jgi:hypothetical protein
VEVAVDLVMVAELQQVVQVVVVHLHLHQIQMQCQAQSIQVAVAVVLEIPMLHQQEFTQAQVAQVLL